jgi:protein CpxP
MTKTRLLTIAVVGLLLVNFGLLAFLVINRPMVPTRGGGRQPIGEGPKKMIIRKLDFNEEQVARYEDLIGGHQGTIQTLNKEVSNTKNRLFATLTSDGGSGADSLINRLGILQMQIEKAHYDHFTKVKKLCRPDQEDRFQALTRELAEYFAMPRNPPPRR